MEHDEFTVQGYAAGRKQTLYTGKRVVAMRTVGYQCESERDKSTLRGACLNHGAVLRYRGQRL